MNLLDYIEKNGIDISITENIYSNNDVQFKDVVNNFINDPYGKILKFDYEFEDCESVEVSIEPRGYEDGFDIRLDGQAVATQIYENEFWEVLQNQLSEFIKSFN